MSFWINVQSKSSAVKAQYAFGIAGVITGLMAIVWISTIPARFTGVAPQEELTTDGNAQNFQQLFNNSKDQLGNVIESIETLPSQLEDSAASTENLNALDRGVSADPETLDSVDIESFKNRNASIAQPTVVPVTEVKEPKVILIEEIKNISTDVPRMILIGTTTAQ